jgi:hypothetical protein
MQTPAAGSQRKRTHTVVFNQEINCVVEKTTPTRSKVRAMPSRKTPQLGHRTRKLHQSHTNTPFPTSGSCSHSARIMHSPNARAASANQPTSLREGSLAKRALLRALAPSFSTQHSRQSAHASHSGTPTAGQDKSETSFANQVVDAGRFAAWAHEAEPGEPLRITPYFVGAMRHPCQGRSRGRRGTLFLKRSWGTASKSRLFLTQSNIRSCKARED